MKDSIKTFLYALSVSLILLQVVFAGTPPQDTKLNFKEIVWAKINDNNRMVTVSDPLFRRGEDVYLVFRQVGPFQKGADGKHHMDIDMTVKGPDGTVVLNKKGLLGDKGHRMLENDYASSPYGIFESNVGLEPGVYRMNVTIHDVIAGKQLSVNKLFRLAEGLSYRKAIFARLGSDNRMEPANDAVFRRGEVVHFVLLNVGKFKKGEDGKHKFEIDMHVTGPAGKVVYDNKNMLGKDGHLELNNDIADSPFGKFYTAVSLDAGIYQMKLTLRDLVAGKILTVTRRFRLK
jgi:hypothetical protein